VGRLLQKTRQYSAGTNTEALERFRGLMEYQTPRPPSAPEPPRDTVPRHVANACRLGYHGCTVMPKPGAERCAHCARQGGGGCRCSLCRPTA
jgi:hypothetical protein